jgi:hypothetical protein
VHPCLKLGLNARMVFASIRVGLIGMFSIMWRFCVRCSINGSSGSDFSISVIFFVKYS